MHWFSRVRTSAPVSKRIYLDHAAATPLLPEAWEVMAPLLRDVYGNPGAVHTEGVAAKVVLQKARTEMARILEVPDNGVVFTSGGTESNNLAIVGYVEQLHGQGRAYADMEIISSAIEHPATKKTLAMLQNRGVVIHEVAVRESGRIDQNILRALCSEKTVMVTVAYVNSEIGTIELVGALGRIVAEVRTKFQSDIVLHVDAAQAPLWLPCVVPQLKVDMMSLDAGKFGGPKGVGALVVRKGVTFAPITFGGGQEFGKRPGTEPVALVAGMVAAFTYAQRDWKGRSSRVQALRDEAIAALITAIPGVQLNGATDTDRVANNINISIPGLDSEFAVVTLDVHGIAASTKSACSSVGGGESVVVRTVTGDTARASSTLRFTLGEQTTAAELTKMVFELSRHTSKRVV